MKNNVSVAIQYICFIFTLLISFSFLASSSWIAGILVALGACLFLPQFREKIRATQNAKVIAGGCAGSNEEAVLNKKLTACGDCGKEISRNAKTCPNCGAKNKQKSSWVGFVLVGLISWGLIVSIQTGTEITEGAQQKASNYAVSPSPVPQQQSWSYFHDDDPMSTGKTHTASLRSSNTVRFSFPYSGEQRGTLALRTHPKHGKDVIFRIEKGQILCPSYDDCTIQVRFDDGESSAYTAVGSADNSTDTIFIRNYTRFVDSMMKAKRVRISVNVYQEGSPVFDFDVSGFSAEQYLPKQ